MIHLEAYVNEVTFLFWTMQQVALMYSVGTVNDRF